MELINNVEEYIFWTGETGRVCIAKLELINQMKTFNISIRGKGFYEINRSFLVSVRARNCVITSMPGTSIADSAFRFS